MKWTREAEEAVRRAPFFVRGRIRKKVEEEAENAGARQVTMAHVEKSRKRFMKRMEDEVRGCRVETCFGSGGCPNRAVDADDLAGRLERVGEKARLKEFLKEKVDGPLKMHHEFRVSVSDCPNACSRPQIADVGLIGASRPEVAFPEECTLCGECAAVCKEGAVLPDEDEGRPVIDLEKCLLCGQCARVCPVGAIIEAEAGYRVQLGGRLGRHPRLAAEIEGIFTEDEALKKVEECLNHHKSHNESGERFAAVLDRTGIEPLGAEKKRTA